MYGICSEQSGFIQTSKTEKGAKQHATRNGYGSIYYCSPHSWSVFELARRVGGKWYQVDALGALVSKYQERLHKSNMQRANDNLMKIHNS